MSYILYLVICTAKFCKYVSGVNHQFVYTTLTVVQNIRQNMYGLREFTACMSNYSAVFAPPRSVPVKLRECSYQITRSTGTVSQRFWALNEITRRDIKTRSSVQHSHFHLSSKNPLLLKLPLF
jgi:hypothetical protein